MLKAQFNCDFSVNSQLTNSDFNHILPKIVSCSNGNSFVSWYEADGDFYNMKMQLIDSLGNKLWTEDLLVGNFHTDSWVTDYSLIIDNENNCVLAYNDYRNDTTNTQQDICLYKISQDAEFLWGNNGISFVIEEEYDFFPRLLLTPSNSIIVAWSNYNYYFTLQKISAEGNLLWGENGIIFQDSPPTIRYQNPLIVNAENENVFVIWTYETGNYMYPEKDIYLQKLDENGNTILTEPTIIYDLSDIPIYVCPVAVPDKKYGTYITWYSFYQNVLNTYISHVDSLGNLTMPLNGVAMQNNSDFSRTYSGIAVDNNNNAVVFWKQSDLNQSEFGIFGQKFSSNGDLLWQNNGINFYELSVISIYGIFAEQVGNDFLLFFEDNSIDNNTQIKSTEKYINSFGGVVWEKIITDYPSNKADFCYSNNVNKQVIAVWYDGRTDYDNLFTQNIFAYSVNLGNDTTITIDDSLILDAGSEFQNYLWNDLSTNQTFLIDDYNVGSYEISVMTQDICNFEYFDTIMVEVTENENISQFDKNYVLIYPNPAKDKLFIDFQNNHFDDIIIKIYNNIGFSVFQKTYSDIQNIQIELSEFENGVYFIEIEDNNFKYYKKIIKN